MKTSQALKWRIGAVGTVIAAAGFLYGCAASGATEDTASLTVVGQDEDVGLSGATIWAQNCGRCHNSRSPAEYSDGQWDVILMHMRIQANLTGEQQRKVAEFLKASN